MRTFIFSMILLVSAIACNSGPSDQPRTDTVPPAFKDHTAVNDDPPADTGTALLLDERHRSVTATLHVDSLHPSVVYYIDVNAGHEIHASLHPSRQPANIRFNQVVTPDGSADGPFGQALSYPFQRRGRYALRIGPSLMAEGRYTGEVVLRVEIE